MPCRLSALAVYLGSRNASFSAEQFGAFTTKNDFAKDISNKVYKN